jgi:hypothetical protein
LAKPVGWRKESQRHALAAKGIATGTKKSSKPGYKAKDFMSKIASEYGLVEGGSYYKKKDGKPIVSLDDNLSVEDIFGDGKEQLDHLKNEYPDIIEPFITYHKLQDKSPLEILKAFYYSTEYVDWWSDEVSQYNDDEAEYLSMLLKDVGFESGDTIRVSAYPASWTGHRGERKFRWKGDMPDFLHNTIRAVDQRGSVSAEIIGVNKEEIIARVSCHDIPTGSTMIIQKLSDTSEFKMEE